MMWVLFWIYSHRRGWGLFSCLTTAYKDYPVLLVGGVT